MMKKWIALLLAAMMLLSATAFAATGDAVLGRGEEGEEVYFRYCFADGETLYLASYEALYTYHVGDAEMTRFDYDVAEDEDEDGYVNVQRYPFAWDGRLYDIELSTVYEEHSDFRKAEIVPLALADGQVSRDGEGTPIDWSELLQYYEQDCYPIEPQNVVVVGSKLFFRYYSDQGDRMWARIDLEAARLETLPELTDVVSLIPYRDGMLLAQVFSYAHPETVTFETYDPQSGATQEISEVTVESYSTFGSMAYDPDTDTVYCAKGGEVHPLDLTTGEVGEGVTDMPIDDYSENGAVILAGGYYACASSGACVRNLDPNQKAASRLKVADSMWTESVNNAFYQFSNAHGDVGMVLSREDSDINNIIESMMNRDSGVDIYVLGTYLPAFEAVRSRGYMMELDGSDTIAAFADTLYPSVREALSYNGKLVGIPVEAYCWSMGANEKALAAVGLTLDDVPKNWSDFLDFLNTLPGIIPDGSGIKPFYGDSVENARSMLFNQIFTDYQNYVNATDPTVGYNTPLLRDILTKLENVDFEALGYEPAEENESMGMRGWSSDEDGKHLFDVSTGCTFGNFYSESTPILMAMDADTPAYFVLQASVAFINPFTQNPEQALAFMEQLTQSLETSVRYCFVPELNEPVRGQSNQKYLDEIYEELDKLQKQLDEAGAQDKQSIEETIASWQENLEYMDKYGWDVSPENLEWYRANDDHIVLMSANWLYNDDSGEAYELINQYIEDQIGMDELLTSIDKKVQMMLLEGN